MTENLIIAGLHNRRLSCVPATSLDKNFKPGSSDSKGFRILVLGNNMVGKTSIIK